MAVSHYIDAIIRKDSPMDKTANFKKLINSRVLSKTGSVIGRVRSAHIHPIKLNLEGVCVDRSLGKRDVYIGSSYIDKATDEGIILTIEPSILLVGKKVLDKNGKCLGIVKIVNRKNHTNEVESIVLSSTLKKDLVIPWNFINSTTHALVILSSYNVKQKYFWQKSG
ncbi:MAG: PRC-barrel domain-containing protein [Candidatus Pacearchaeota archaeon]